MTIPRYPRNPHAPITVYSPGVAAFKRQQIIQWLSLTPKLEQGLKNKTIMKIAELNFVPKDFAVLLWSTKGVMPCVTKIFSEAYQYINEPTMDVNTFQLLMETLTILEWIALDNRTKKSLMATTVLTSVYPFLLTNFDLPFYCYIKNRILTMFNLLLMMPFNVVINFLLETEFIYIIIFNMVLFKRETSAITVSIMEKILRHPKSLIFVCASEEPLAIVVDALNITLEGMALNFPDFYEEIGRMPLHNIIMCFTLISTNSRGKSFLKDHFPETFSAFTFQLYLMESPVTRNLLVILLDNLIPPTI
ncbi:unnamed protein product [Brassicogethes aeneus]|uniref:CCR4-NOT transcription complex subunit 9 n=1 Tax=Brassicogethes aeneus TaxID=1431903 RepID=A0A9P0FM69_BRAAE|nr:unnamed protein product [Brassicogethes aeneus]